MNEPIRYENRKTPWRVAMAARRIRDGYSSLVDAAKRTSDAIVAHQKGMDDFYDGQGDWESVWNAGHWLRTTLDAIQHGDGFREGERWFIERLLDLPEDPDAK